MTLNYLYITNTRFIQNPVLSRSHEGVDKLIQSWKTCTYQPQSALSVTRTNTTVSPLGDIILREEPHTL